MGTVVQRSERELKELSTLNEGTKVWNFVAEVGLTMIRYVILNCRLSLLELNKLNGCFAISEVVFARSLLQ